MDAGSPVEHISDNGSINLVLGIIHVGGLWLERCTKVEAKFLLIFKLASEAEQQLGIVVVLVVCSILRVLTIEQPVQSIHARDVTHIKLFGSEIGVLLQKLVKVIHRAVTIREAVLELVATLKVHVLS